MPGGLALAINLPLFLLVSAAGERGLAILTGGLTVVLLGLLGALRVRVDQAGVSLRFGVGVLRRHFAREAIQSVSAVRNRWTWGFGIRRFPGGRLYNISGLSAVELRLASGERVRVGSNDAHGLLAAIERHLALPATEAPPLDAKAVAAAKRRKMWSLGLTALFAVGLVVIVSRSEKPPEVRVEGDAIRVVSTLYSAKVLKSELRRVELVDHLPAIERRTNGHAGFGGTLRGHFEMAGLGVGMLFVETAHPPFLFLQSTSGFLFVNFEDPERTRALAATIKADGSSAAAARPAP